MSENDVVVSILTHLKRQNNDWHFVMGKISLTRDEMIEKIQEDTDFRKTVVSLVNDLSIDILLRHPK